MAKVWPTGQLQLTRGLSTYPLHSHSSLGGTLDLTSFCLTRTSPQRAGWLRGKSPQSPGIWGPLML